MAFEALDQTKPLGTDERRFGDDVIRQHIRAIRQRLSSVFVDIDVDPMVAKPGIIPGTAIADLGVATGKLADGGVTQVKLAKPSVGTAELIDANVTNAKLGPASVTQAKLAKPSVGSPEVILESLTGAHIAPNSIFSGNMAGGLFTFEELDATNSFTLGAVAPAGKYMKGNGVKAVWGDILTADIPDAVLQKLLMRCDGFFVDNVPTSSSSFFNRYRTTGGPDENAAIMTRAGEVRGLWVRANADRTGGTFTAKVTKNGVDTGITAVIDGVNVRFAITTPAAGALTFVAGDYLGISWTSVAYTPLGTVDLIAGFEVRYT